MKRRRSVTTTTNPVVRVVVVILYLVAIISKSSVGINSCHAFVTPSSSSSLTSKTISTSSTATTTRSSLINTRLYAFNRRGRNDAAERLKRQRDELEAKAIRQELLAELKEAELSRSRIERDIRDAESRRRALDQQTSNGRYQLDNLQNGGFGAVNAAKKFLDTNVKGGKRQQSKLDLERERLESELDELRSRQKSEEATRALGQIGGVAAALGVAANIFSGNSDLIEFGDATGLGQIFPSTSKYLSDLSSSSQTDSTKRDVAMPYLDKKIVAVQAKEEQLRKQEAQKKR